MKNACKFSDDLTMREGRVICFGLIAALLFSGCAYGKALVSPKPAGFISERSSPEIGEALPFARVWRGPDVDLKKYTKIVIAPISTSYVPDDKWLLSANEFIRSRSAYCKYVDEIARYAEHALVTALQNDKGERFVVVEEGDQETLQFELAITEVVFDSPTMYAASFALPIPFVNQAINAGRAPVLAFEARVRDWNSGEVLATVADRRIAQIKLLDFNRLTPTRPHKEIFDIWVDELLASASRKEDEKVARYSPFSLLPW